MRYFIDTEFIESGHTKPIQALSLAVVREDGESRQWVYNDANLEDASQWVRDNVLPHIDFTKAVPRAQIAAELLAFVGGDEKPVFWGFYCDYDWVVLAQTFGTMMDLPKGWPMFCMDLKQWCKMLGNPRLEKDPSLPEHDALADAMQIKLWWEFLKLGPVVKSA